MQKYNLKISIKIPKEYSNNFDDASNYIYSKLSQFNINSLEGALVHTDGDSLFLSTDCEGESLSYISNILQKELASLNIDVLDIKNEFN